MTRYIDFLTPDELRDMGIDGPWPLGRADRVRFHELDALNHANNAAYVAWVETFRVTYAIRYGLAYYAPDAPLLLVKSAEYDYRRPLLLNDDYVVTGRTVSLRRTSFVMDYAVYSDGLAATARAVHVLFEADGTTRRAIPDDIRTRMIEADGAVAE